MPSANRLCYILTNRPPSHYWGGPGMRPLTALSLSRLPCWEDRPSALRAARALREAINLDLHPQPLRLLT